MDVQELLAKMGTNLTVGRAFGAAYEKEGTLIIPVAVVAGGGGGGEGTGPNADVANRGANDVVTPDPPGGSGGGFGGLVLPVGAFVVKEDTVRWVPAVSANVVIFALVAVLRLLLRSRRRSHRRGH